jgi:hypothetical protein
MKNYTIYFEIYGKKMKTTVMAENEEKAKELVIRKIIFHKVEKSKDEFNEAIDMMDDMLNFLGGKKRP